MSLGMHYCGQSLVRAWEGGMEDVVALEEWEEVLRLNPSNRRRFLDQDRREFISTMERWMFAYCPCGDEIVPGLPDADARTLDIPAEDLLALAGYDVPDRLPNFTPYLRAKYELPPEAIADLERYFDLLRNYYDIPADQDVFPAKPKPTTEPLLVKVNDQDKFHAFPGVNKDRLAVQVATLISDEEE